MWGGEFELQEGVVFGGNLYNSASEELARQGLTLGADLRFEPVELAVALGYASAEIGGSDEEIKGSRLLAALGVGLSF